MWIKSGLIIQDNSLVNHVPKNQNQQVMTIEYRYWKVSFEF